MPQPPPADADAAALAPWCVAPLGRQPGLGMRMASGAPDSLRGTVQRNLSRILFERSPLATSQSWACTSLRDARAPVLQQSGDFWMRVDCHWESPPQSIFLTLDSEDFVAAMRLWLDQFPCCLDADCGRRMQRLPPDKMDVF